jgi:hypothetical protein
MSKERRRSGSSNPATRSRPSNGVISQAPVVGDSEFNQVGVLIVEEHLGFSPSTLTEVRAMCRKLPFEPAMLTVASLAHGQIEATMSSSAKQMRLVESVFAPGLILDRYRELLSSDRRLQIWGPQSLYVLMRLLIDEAADAPISQQLKVADKIGLLRVLIASNSIVESGRSLNKPPGLEDLLAFETQIGSYYARPTWLEDMTRPQALLRLSDTSPLTDDPSCVPINEWIERSGLNAGEQWELGFGLGATTNAWEPSRSPWIDQAVRDDALNKLGFAPRTTEALTLLSATRDTLRDSFAAMGTSPDHVAWETRPFNRTPFLRLQEGGLLLMGRPWIQNWLGDGFYYRPLDVARELDRDRASGRKDRPPGTPVVGEQAYTKGRGAKTSDVAVLVGRDLVLFEVHGRRPAAEPFIGGNQVEIIQELRKLLLRR